MGPTADAPVLRYYDIGPGVTAFSTTRYGGYSSGPYGGMNVNRWCGDDPETVARNMTALGNTLWPDKYKDGKSSFLIRHTVRRWFMLTVN